MEKDQKIGDGITDTHFQRDMYALQHSEIITPNLPQSIFGKQKGDALKAFLEKNGHPTSTYMIQQNQTAFRVMEMDKAGDMFRFWGVGF